MPVFTGASKLVDIPTSGFDVHAMVGTSTLYLQECYIVLGIDK